MQDEDRSGIYRPSDDLTCKCNRWDVGVKRIDITQDAFIAEVPNYFKHGGCEEAGSWAKPPQVICKSADYRVRLQKLLSKSFDRESMAGNIAEHVVPNFVTVADQAFHQRFVAPDVGTDYEECRP
jgi:hypothetical protein